MRSKGSGAVLRRDAGAGRVRALLGLLLLLLLLAGCRREAPQAPPPAAQAAPEASGTTADPAAEPELEPEFIPARLETAEADQTPEPDAALEALLTETVAAYPGTWRVCCRRLDTGVGAAVGQGPGVAASLIKLFVAGAYLEAVEQGTLEDRWQTELEEMITESSNAACNTLIDVLGQGDEEAGKAAVNVFAEALGCGDTQLNRKMLEASDLENYTSPEDCVALLQAVWAGELVSDQASKTLCGLLEGQTRRSKIPAGLPDGVRCGNKTGELAQVENDAAIVWMEAGAYALCVMVEDTPAPGATQSQIAALSQIVYEYYTEPA